MTKQGSQGSDPDPKDLHEPVNWMAYSHRELYLMLTQDVDLNSANEARDGWEQLKTVFTDIQTQLQTAIRDSDQGWEGEAAEKARDALRDVADWTGTTAATAAGVAGCIDTEIKNVTEAIRAMPPPPEPVQPPVPVPPQRLPFHQSMAEMVGVQTSPFAEAPAIASPTLEMVAATDASHRQAADVMAAFQRNSIAVDQTVPQLAPPTNPVNAPGSAGGGSVVTPTGNPTSTDTTTAGAAVATAGQQQQNTRTAGAGQYGRVSAGGGGYSSRTFMPPAAATGVGAGGGLGAPSAGGSAGVMSESGRGAGAAAAAAAQGGGVNQTKAFQNPLQMGAAAPMAAPPPAAGNREDEREYKHASYLEEDDNVFGLDRKAAPPVIGQ